MRLVLSLVLALMLVSGHVAGLQVVAWAGMFLDRVQTRTVTEALVSTVDGSAPCAMCRAAQALHQDDAPAGKTPLKADKLVKKADGLPSWPDLALGWTGSAGVLPAVVIGMPFGRAITPDVPPPRI